MLGNESQKDPSVADGENQADEMEVIYHCIDCPYCCNGGVPFEYENGEVEWETCDVCHGLGHLPILED
jgi:hypothetical protein